MKGRYVHVVSAERLLERLNRGDEPPNAVVEANYIYIYIYITAHLVSD